MVYDNSISSFLVFICLFIPCRWIPGIQGARATRRGEQADSYHWRSCRWAEFGFGGFKHGSYSYQACRCKPARWVHSVSCSAFALIKFQFQALLLPKPARGLHHGCINAEMPSDRLCDLLLLFSFCSIIPFYSGFHCGQLVILKWASSMPSELGQVPILCYWSGQNAGPGKCFCAVLQYWKGHNSLSRLPNGDVGLLQKTFLHANWG